MGDGVKKDCGFIESYIEEVLGHCNGMEWTAKEPIQIDFSVFIAAEIKANRMEKQQIFNNLIFDTLNEVMSQFKWNAKRTQCSAKGQLIKSVLEKMRKIAVCESSEDLKDRFGDDQEIDDRIRTISTDWMQDFEHS